MIRQNNRPETMNQGINFDPWVMGLVLNTLD